MNTPLTFLTVLRRHAPVLISLLIAAVCSSVLAISALKLADGELTQDRITAQQERFLKSVYDDFEEARKRTTNASPIPQDLKSPFTP